MMLGQHVRTTMGQRWPNIVILSGAMLCLDSIGCWTPVGVGVQSRMCHPSPQRVVKGDLIGRFLGRNNRIKRVTRVGAWTGTLKNPTKCLWRLEPDRRSNIFFFSPPANLCAVTYMTTISLIATLNNQFTSLRLLELGLRVW